MDPDAALDNARDALRRHRENRFNDDEDGDEIELTALRDLADAFEALDGWLSKSGFKPGAAPFCDDMGTEYLPWTDGTAAGLRATNDGRVVYIYLNPSSSDEGSDRPTPTVFLYVGEEGDPAQDGADTHYELFHDWRDR